MHAKYTACTCRAIQRKARGPGLFAETVWLVRHAGHWVVQERERLGVVDTVQVAVIVARHALAPRSDVLPGRSAGSDECRDAASSAVLDWAIAKGDSDGNHPGTRVHKPRWRHRYAHVDIRLRL